MSYLKKRHNTWYARMGIPAAARSTLGRHEFVRSLQTTSSSEAQRRAVACVAEWKELIAQALSADKIKAEAMWWKQVLSETACNSKIDMLTSLLSDKVESIHHADSPEEAQLFYGLVTGALVDLNDYLESWHVCRSQEVSAKTAMQEKYRVARMVERFRFTTKVDRKGVTEWITEQRGELSAATVRKIIRSCSVFWKYLQDRELVAEGVSPFHGHEIKPQAKEKLYKQMLPYSAEEVIRLHYEAAEKNKVNLARAIRIAAYTGFRQDEICKLTVDDVIEKEGVLCLRLDESKTEAGLRVVPVHDKLMPLIEELRDAALEQGDGYLLPDERFDRYGQRSRNISKQFSVLKTKLGFTERHDFHSLRRTVATLLEQAGVEELHAARVLGHSLKTMSYGLYSGGTSMELLKRAINAIDYGEEGLGF